MYKFIPIICLMILVAACSGPISQVKEDELVPPVSEIVSASAIGEAASFGEGEDAQAMFYFLDVNHDGTIAREELMVIYPDMVIVAEQFTTFDKDGDGDIELEEFVDVYSAFDEDEAAQAMFYVLDVNHDGTIAREELMVIYHDMVIVTEKFTTFDKDGNGTIVIEEFVEVY